MSHEPVPKGEFQKLARAYHTRWPVRLCVCDVSGAVMFCSPAGHGKDAAESKHTRALAIAESLRWGEPTFHLCPPGRIIWAMPVMHNARLLGGIVAEVDETQAFTGSFNIRPAAAALQQAVETCNWTNAALLSERRSQSRIEQHRAQAIHEWKAEQHYDFHRMYQLEEPALLGAIRRGDRREARAALNRLLVGMVHAAGSRLDLAKSFFLELVVTMTRTAVQAGGAPDELLGANFASITQLADIDSDEALARWLGQSLEQVLAGLHLRRESTDEMLLSNALRFMQRHYHENIGRDDVAEVACMSPSHFSRVFRKHFGRGFSDLLNQMRVDRAAELLLRSDRAVAVIALESGFADQSYFTKVFRKYRGMTPADYRRQNDTISDRPD